MAMNPIVSSSNLICLVGGASLGRNTISSVFHLVDAFVGVDGGANHLLQAGVTPAAVIGDLDSLSPAARATFADVLHHIPEQATTDFEKALTRVAAPAILALAFTGGRMDHGLSVLNVMARYPARAVILVDDDEVCFMAQTGRTRMELAADTPLSIMPVAPVRVTVGGVVWSFDNQMMSPDGFTSPSNAASGGPVTLDTDGPVLVTLPRAQLQIALKAAVRAG